MDNEELTLEKLRLMGMYGCVRVAPFMEFEDGTKGSVLLLRYNADDSLVVLVNSPERTDEYTHGKNNTLFPSELDQFYAYREFCKEKYNGHYCMSKERYDEFGIVVLTDVFLSAVIADFICDNLNRQKTDPRHITNWSTSRTSNMLSQALHGCTIYELEDEITVFLSEDSDWQRAILLETMALFHADQVLVKNLHIDWNIVRNKYAEWLGQNNIAVKLYFAKQVLAAYHQSEQPINWRRLLEDALRDQREYQMEFRYSDYGIQEIFGLYALSKYLYTEKPTDFAIRYAHLEQKERVSIFKHYCDACTDEMLEELNAEDDPFRTELPTKEEAEEKSKIRIASLVGRQPEGLTDEQKEDYKKYELAFCRKLQVDVKEEEEQKDNLPHLGTQNNQGCTVNNFFVAPPASPQDSVESPSVPKKRGPKTKLLFVTQEGKEDIARTKEEKERLRMYLNDHKLGSRKLTTEKDNILLKIVVCFYRKWLQNGYVSDYNATAAVRFLTETCEIPHEVDKVSIANRLQQMLKSGEYDRETAGMVSEYF